jgi:hypothetical protein
MVIIVFSLKFILRLYLQLTSLKKDNLIPYLQMARNPFFIGFLAPSFPLREIPDAVVLVLLNLTF